MVDLKLGRASFVKTLSICSHRPRQNPPTPNSFILSQRINNGDFNLKSSLLLELISYSSPLPPLPLHRSSEPRALDSNSPFSHLLRRSPRYTFNFPIHFSFSTVHLLDLRSGVRKEEIRVEVEDSRYLIIRTEVVPVDGSVIVPAKSFWRNFRLPALVDVDVDAILAGLVNGVLEITVPRWLRTASSIALPADSSDRLRLLARAA